MKTQDLYCPSFYRKFCSRGLEKFFAVYEDRLKVSKHKMATIGKERLLENWRDVSNRSRINKLSCGDFCCRVYEEAIRLSASYWENPISREQTDELQKEFLFSSLYEFRFFNKNKTSLLKAAKRTDARFSIVEFVKSEDMDATLEQIVCTEGSMFFIGTQPFHNLALASGFVAGVALNFIYAALKYSSFNLIIESEEPNQ